MATETATKIHTEKMEQTMPVVRGEPPIQLAETDSPQQQWEGSVRQTPSKPTLAERLHKFGATAGGPLNRAANFVGAEGWWPASMDRECDKAARILYSFIRKTTLASRSHPHRTRPLLTNVPGTGVPAPPSANGPKHATGLSRHSLVKIPTPVLRNCAGLAVFNVFRAGVFEGSLAAGSGVVVARRPDGTWSPPSAFVVSTLGAGFTFGLDIYECVCVLTTEAQVRAFSRPRVSLGGEAAVAVGPLGTGAAVQAAIGGGIKPVWTYMKSRGLWAGVQVDGTVVLARPNTNAAFYGEPGVSAERILHGDVAWPEGGQHLFQVLHAIDLQTAMDASIQDTTGGPLLAREAGQEKNGFLDVPEPEHESALDEKNRLEASG